MKQSQLNSEYVKNIEKRNDTLDDQNLRLNAENERIKEEIKLVRGACQDFESCLAIILEKYGSDKDIYKLIMKTLTDTSKKLLKQKV